MSLDFLVHSSIFSDARFSSSPSHPAVLSLLRSTHTVSNLVQEYIFVPLLAKECYFAYLMREIVEDKSVIVFLNTCK